MRVTMSQSLWGLIFLVLLLAACSPVAVEPAADVAGGPTATGEAYPALIPATATLPPYPWPTVAPGPTFPPDPTQVPTATEPPVPTSPPTPVVTTIPTAAPPFIPFPSGTAPQPFTLYWQDEDVIRSMSSADGEQKVFFDPSAELGLYFAPKEARLGSWGSISPDGQHFALVLTDIAQPLDYSLRSHPVNIYVLNRDSGALRLLVKNGAEPVWSPNGKRLAYRSVETGSLWVVEADSGVANELYRVDSNNGHVATDFSWAPDNRHLVLIDELFRQSRDLVVVDAERVEESRILTASPTHWVYLPQWSPTSDQISFVWLAGEGAENWHLWVTNSDGTNQRQLTREIDVLAGGGAPVWSPDGKWIAFSGAAEHEAIDSQIDLWLISPDGTDLKRLTFDRTEGVNDHAFNETAPQWSPDGAQIIFHQGAPEVWLFSLIDGRIQKLFSSADTYEIGLTVSN